MVHPVANLSNCTPSNQVCIPACELERPVLCNPSPREYAAMKRIFRERDSVP